MKTKQKVLHLIKSGDPVVKLNKAVEDLGADMEEQQTKAEGQDEKIEAAAAAAAQAEAAATATVDAVAALTTATSETTEAVEAITEEMKSVKTDIKMFVKARDHNVEKMGGYQSHRQFLDDVRVHAITKTMSDRLALCKTVGTDEGKTTNNPDGGFLIPVGMLPGIEKTDPFATQTDFGTMTRNIPMGSPSIDINARVDKDHSSSVSGGLQVYRAKEADTVEATKTQYEQINLKATKLMGIAYATSELLEDSPESFSAIIQAGFNDEFISTMNDERIRGTGVGEYLGILNSPALISQAKVAAQTATTINATNVLGMRSRAWNYGSAVWIANQDTYIQLANLHQTGTNTDWPLYIPSNGTDVPDTLLGRPVIFDENASTLGQVGDIMLVSWSEYLEGFIGAATFEESIHVRFVYDEKAFRFTVRNAGAPWWRTALTPKNSTTTLSPFVTLAIRE